MEDRRSPEQIDPDHHGQPAGERHRAPNEQNLRGKLAALRRFRRGAPDADRAQAEIDHRGRQTGQADDELYLAVGVCIELACEIGKGEQANQLGRNLAANQRAKVAEESCAAFGEILLVPLAGPVGIDNERLFAELTAELTDVEMPFLAQ